MSLRNRTGLRPTFSTRGVTGSKNSGLRVLSFRPTCRSLRSPYRRVRSAFASSPRFTSDSVCGTVLTLHRLPSGSVRNCFTIRETVSSCAVISWIGISLAGLVTSKGSTRALPNNWKNSCESRRLQEARHRISARFSLWSRETLNRPGAVLQRMKEEKQEHFFHQYLDQTADPEFSSLFDKYRRTSTSATAKRRSMEEEMRNMISLRFVDARRNQIRGYGYDEFAIFAELVQNAEDAYSQRDQLELPEPPGRGVTFTYSVADGGKNLSVSHYGRPFNLWRHGAKRIDAFRYDVEGVLKSAGSFKPHSRTDGVRPVGRFGLGFKSVYLVTDTPRIHSGDWHFEITAGCIPNEITAPVDWEKGQTRIVLPLITGAPEERDSVRGRYANLLPFLRNVGDLRVEHSDGTSLDLKTTSRRMLCTTDGHQVDHVEISGVTHASGGVIRLLRGRHDGHEGQLGVLLGSDRLPVAWSDVFDSDVFAVLPLRVRLSCGVGVSNLFEVQSGRTHLIDPTTNLERITEVAGSLRTLTKALIADDNVSTREVMSRFWGLWRWDGGDEEACDLRRALARELVQLTRSMSVIPTRHPKQFVKLGPDVLFSFENLPEELADKLLEKAIELAVDGRRVRVQESNVLPTPIRSAVERVYAAAGETGGVAVTRIGWSELGEEFQVQPWLADHPDLVSAMARNLPLDGLEQVQPWLCKCVFRSASGNHEHLTDLLPSRFPGRDHLPRRLLNLLDDAYDEAALGLLKQVGLPSRPALETMKSWLRSGLDRNECDNVLQYLSEAGRWRREYYDLGSLLNTPWFDDNGVRITAADAFASRAVLLRKPRPGPRVSRLAGDRHGYDPNQSRGGSLGPTRSGSSKGTRRDLDLVVEGRRAFCASLQRTNVPAR